MFAIAFDLIVEEVQARHPKSVPTAHSDIARALKTAGFRRIQGSVFVTEEPGLMAVTKAMVALKAIVWFPPCVRDIRAFKVEDWSDFTAFIKDR
jgi:virulence-associated protein VapD